MRQLKMLFYCAQKLPIYFYKNSKTNNGELTGGDYDSL